MGLAPLLQDAPLTEEQETLRTQFFEATGYGPSDILSLNYTTHEFLTQNGGHYRFEGPELIHLDGPPPEMQDRWEF